MNGEGEDMNRSTDVVVVREYRTSLPPPTGAITILKRKAFDTRGYSYLRTNPENGFHEWVPTERLEHFRKVFDLSDDEKENA